jgi:hypothetical protein
MTALHIVLGVGVIAVNALAGVLGALGWRRGVAMPGFWPLLRAGQALVVLAVVQGGVLQLSGHDLPPLHLIYGLVPLGVSFVAEQLRVASAQSVLDQRRLEGTEAVRALPEREQRELVAAIVRREIGVMAAAALVIALLGVRAAGWI